MEARQSLIALTQQPYEFGHQTEAKEIEMWRRLGLVAMKDEMQATLAQYHGEIKSEVNRMQEQLALLQGKDVDKVVVDLALLRVDQDYVKQELVPGL